jgi:methylthioribose-1-phosphate isomerase
VAVETLRWTGNHLEMIDQRLLPDEIKYPSFHNAHEVAAGITRMVVRGAPAIGVAAAYGVALEARCLSDRSNQDFINGMERAFEVLAKSRPTAVNLFWAIQRMRDTLTSLCRQRIGSSGEFGPKTSVIADSLVEEAIRIHHEDVQTNLNLGAHGAKLLPDGCRVLTHCNAGALATAGHGTALGVIRSAVAQGKRISVIADETRPFLQGARLTAWEMVQEGIPCTLITDNMAGHLMAKGEVDAVVVGADRVAKNGDVANKIGTYMVAVLAKYHEIPFYVASPLSTIDVETETGEQIVIEERGEGEIVGYREIRWAPEGVAVRNPAFDVTPAKFVSALITEKGVIKDPEAGKITATLTTRS